jgi:hypothetical protein
MEQIRKSCCCPSIVIAIAGPFIAVHGAILNNGRWVVQPLTHMINLQWNDHENEAPIKMLARLFKGIKASMDELSSFYSSLQIPNIPTGEVWPVIQGIGKYQFQYIDSLHSNVPWRLVYKARMTQPKEQKGRIIVVKFSQSYSYEAHGLLAARGLAPELIHHSEDAIPGLPGMKMILMDFVQETNLDDKLSSKALARVRQAIRFLHEKDLVFGDLRRGNVLETETGAMLVDFDWAGKDGEVRYPWRLNTKDIAWPEGVKPREWIFKSHDLAMLEKL